MTSAPSARALWSLLLTMTMLLAALTAALPAAAHHDDEVRSGDYQQVVTLIYPTDPATTSFSESYAAPRSGGRVHKATDIMGRKLTPLYAAVDGTICSITGVNEPMPSWGYSLTVCGEDGRRYRYIHINNDNPGTDDGRGGPEWAYAPGVRRGVRVTAGQWVGYMGDSGNAENTAPHLHFEILDDRVTDPFGDHRINPYPSLMAARAAGRVLAGAPQPGPVTPTMRIAGSDRVGTAIATSTVAWPHAPAVVVALSVAPAEAIVAGPLAAQLDAPVLLTAPHELEGRVAAEIGRLGARHAVLVGGAAGVPGIDGVLTAAGIQTVERLAGADVHATAATVAQRVWDDTPLARRQAVLALGTHPDPNRAWPDALTASWYGAVTDAPVLLTDPGGLPAPSAAALTGVGSVTIVGGRAAVDDTVATAVQTLSGRQTRLSGDDRYATAVAVADALGSRVERSWVWAATGRNWADAVTAGAAVARTGESFVLIDGLDGGGDAATGRWLWRHGNTIEAGRILGGAAAIDARAEQRFIRRTS
jgi:hypothetical protein